MTTYTAYPAPIDGTYNYKAPRFDGTFNWQQVKVWILAESPKRFRIRLRLPAGNHRQGHEMSICKHNVIIHRPRRQPVHYDYSEAWWNN